MEKIKVEIKKHYKKVIILLVITTLKGVLVKTPATVEQLFNWVVLSVLIAMIGGELKNIKLFFEEMIYRGRKREQQINDFNKH